MERKLLLIRHGKTDWNNIYRIQGWKDIPLNKEGLSSSKKLADFLKKTYKTIDIIYSSDLLRAYMTASIISNKFQKLPIEISKNLREQNLGEFEGKFLDKFTPEDNKKFSTIKYSRNANNIQYTTAELYPNFKNRVVKIFYDIIEQTKDKKTISIITHGGVIKLIAKEILNYNDEDNFYSIKNSSLTVLSINNDDKIKVDIFNYNNF